MSSSKRWWTAIWCDFTPKTMDFTPKTMDFTPKTMDFTSETMDFTPKTMDFTPKTMDVRWSERLTISSTWMAMAVWAKMKSKPLWSRWGE